MLSAPFTNSAPSATIVVPVPLIPFSNVVVLSVPVIFNVPLFATSIPASFPLNVTFESSAVPSFAITAFPLLFVNVTVDITNSPFVFTVIALSKPLNASKSFTVNFVSSLTIIPCADVVLTNMLLLPFIIKSSFNALCVTPSATIQAVK